MFEILQVDFLQNRLRLPLRGGTFFFFWIGPLERAAGYQIDFVENPLWRVFQWSLLSILWRAAILGSLDFYFVVHVAALFWMDLCFVPKPFLYKITCQHLGLNKQGDTN